MIAHSDKSLQHYAHKTLLQRLLIMTLAITLVVRE